MANSYPDFGGTPTARREPFAALLCVLNFMLPKSLLKNLSFLGTPHISAEAKTDRFEGGEPPKNGPESPIFTQNTFKKVYI